MSSQPAGVASSVRSRIAASSPAPQSISGSVREPPADSPALASIVSPPPLPRSVSAPGPPTSRLAALLPDTVSSPAAAGEVGRQPAELRPERVRPAAALVRLDAAQRVALAGSALAGDRLLGALDQEQRRRPGDGREARVAEAVRPRAAVDDVVAVRGRRGAHELVVARVARGRVGADAEEQRVGAAPGEERVAAGRPVERVVPRPAVERVVAGVAAQGVATALAAHPVGARAALGRIAPAAAHERDRVGERHRRPGDPEVADRQPVGSGAHAGGHPGRDAQAAHHVGRADRRASGADLEARPTAVLAVLPNQILEAAAGTDGHDHVDHVVLAREVGDRQALAGRGDPNRRVGGRRGKQAERERERRRRDRDRAVQRT